MFAVVDIQGQQFKVTEKSKYYVPRLKNDPDSEITFENILMFGDDKGTKIGSPFIDKMKVTAKVLEHIKDDKVIVFKKKRRTGYQKSNGHRQQLTRIEILKIGKSREPKKEETK
jgi:large subunit ribosomal protein L21